MSRETVPWKAPPRLPLPIVTERLVLRMLAPGDAPSLWSAIECDRPVLQRWLPWPETQNRTAEGTLATIRMFLGKAHGPGTPDYVIGITDRVTGAVVGGTGLHRINPADHTADVGYWIRPDMHGRGLCPEAVAALLSSVFTAQADGGWGFRRATVYCDRRNAASASVPRKLGMRLEREERAVSKLGEDGAWSDVLGFALLADEWDCAAHRVRD